MSITRLAPVALLVPLMLAACGRSETPAEETPPPQGEVLRETTPTATPAPTPAPVAAIQTQPGSNGLSVALTRAAVVGDVLTVQLSYSRPGQVSGGETARYAIDQVGVIDNATSQRFGVLKDATGRWQAAPIESGGNNINVFVRDQPMVVWFKFPAPPATSPTISLNIPDVGPFDGVPVTR